MFWKRKNKDNQFISLESQDQRASVRVQPMPSTPIKARLQGTPVRIKDISGGGIAFYNNGFKAGDTRIADMELPEEEVGISVKTEILGVDKHGVCHCRFVGLDEESINRVHRYMLRVQIEEKRQKKQNK
ncbi:MAG: PilZ domain-containing protein [Deltaproteobacteria bacterium]|nr:PilZ domain-containing protein [Deltaproteobacteria bacterium]